MRYESWPRAVAAIKGLEDQRPIFLFANLLEDAQLAEFENGDESTEPDSDLIDYLRFPLSAFSLSPTRVIPRPTLSGNAFQPVNIRQIRDANGCWVLTRSDASTFERIASELNQKLTRSKNPEFEFEIQTQFVRLNNKDDARIPEWLSLFRVDLVPAN